MSTDTPSIWHREVSFADVDAMVRGNMGTHVGIELEEIGADFMRASMPVDTRTKQAFGLLHGGASCVLAEALGSVAGNHCVDYPRKVCVGLEINANHVRGVRGGRVTATARPLHLGTQTQVWDIQLRDDDGALCCVSRLTLAIIANPAHSG